MAPGVREERVGDQRLLARAGLDDDLDVLGAEALDDVGDERDAALAGSGLLGHSDLHEGGKLSDPAPPRHGLTPWRRIGQRPARQGGQRLRR